MFVATTERSSQQFREKQVAIVRELRIQRLAEGGESIDEVVALERGELGAGVRISGVDHHLRQFDDQMEIPGDPSRVAGWNH
jgi:hypothetical protein